MMIELAEAVLYAMWRKSEDEGTQLFVDTQALGDAMGDIDRYERHVHLTKTDGGRRLRVQFS